MGDTFAEEKKGLEGVVNATFDNNIMLLGPIFSRETVSAAAGASIFNITMFSPAATSSPLSDKELYNTFLRLVPPDNAQGFALLDLLDYYYHETGQIQWKQIAIISTADDYGINAASDFISKADDR